MMIEDINFSNNTVILGYSKYYKGLRIEKEPQAIAF